MKLKKKCKESKCEHKRMDREDMKDDSKIELPMIKQFPAYLITEICKKSMIKYEMFFYTEIMVIFLILILVICRLSIRKISKKSHLVPPPFFFEKVIFTNIVQLQ